MLEWFFKLLVLAVLAALAYFVYLDKRSCEEGGGFLVRGVWGYECIKR